MAGIEFSDTSFVPLDDYTKVVGGVIVGKSTGNSEAEIENASPHGVIGPRSEWFSIDGTKFFNFDFNNAAAMGDCSHCFHPASTDMGARTIAVNDVAFTNVSKRIKYQYPMRGIFWDQDGSLTGLGENSWATPNWIHNRQVECSLDQEDLYDGMICDNTVQVR